MVSRRSANAEGGLAPAGLRPNEKQAKMRQMLTFKPVTRGHRVPHHIWRVLIGTGRTSRKRLARPQIAWPSGATSSVPSSGPGKADQDRLDAAICLSIA